MAIPKTNNGLNPRQERFCQEYLKDLNGTKAAERAGYAEKGAAVEASRLLRNTNIVARVKVLMDERSGRTAIDADTILRELLKLATADLRKLFDEKGALLSPDDWPNDVAMAVSSIQVDEIWEGYGKDRKQIGETKKIRLWDKPKALELLGRHLKLFTDMVVDLKNAPQVIVRLPSNGRDKKN